MARWITLRQRRVECLLEVGVELEGGRVHERQGLGVDRAGDAAGRVHPEMGVEQAGPGTAARRPHARERGEVEQQAEAPLEAGAEIHVGAEFRVRRGDGWWELKVADLAR